MAHSDSFALLLPECALASANLPVVVLMGWVGAERDGALLKYADFLAQHGYTSVRSVQPTAVAFSPFEAPRRRWAEALLAFLQAHSLWPQRQLVLFPFSNGGAFVVEQLLLLAESHPRYAQLPSSVAAFVFDSAPAYMHPGALERVLAETEPPGLARSLKSAYYRAATRLLGGSRPQTFWENMLRLSWKRPLLFLYSADDHLCDGAKLDELVAAKQARGQRVSVRRWQQSQHVGHFRRHRQEYATLLLDFLAGLQAQGQQQPLAQPQVQGQLQGQTQGQCQMQPGVTGTPVVMMQATGRADQGPRPRL